MGIFSKIYVFIIQIISLVLGIFFCYLGYTGFEQTQTITLESISAQYLLIGFAFFAFTALMAILFGIFNGINAGRHY